jgi:hypothetical protein
MSETETKATVYWGIRKQILESIRQLERDANIKKKDAEKELAAHFGITQVLIRRNAICATSPVARCVNDPNASNPWQCLYCGKL